MPLQDDIISKVDDKERDTRNLRDRMDEDYSLWLLEEYTGAGAGFQAYTSNEPATLGSKAVSILSGAAITVQVRQNNDDRSTRDNDNAKEQFALGNFRSNDQRLGKMGLPGLRSQISWYLPIRGWTCGRSLLNKRGQQTWADATPWDPREVMWEFGPDGLLWICHKYVSLASQIKAEYGKNVFQSKMHGDVEDRSLVLRYDYYDPEENVVIIPDARETPVKKERHGMEQDGQPAVPCWAVASTLQPPIVPRMSGSFTSDTEAINHALRSYGESIYRNDRRLYDDHNFMMSIRKELAERGRKPVFGIRSRDGIKLVEGDPFKAGGEIPLAEGEELIVYDFIKSAPDIDPFQAILSSEMQRGGFSTITFGESNQNISGFAMQTLKAGDAADKINPFIQAEQTTLRQISNLWSDHFRTGGFPSLELSGVGNNRRWFAGRITPEDIEDLPEVEITLVPVLPELEAARAQLAQLYRQPGTNGLPLKSDYTIREHDLVMQNSDQESDAIFQEVGAMAHPLAQLETLTMALAKRGDPRAKYYAAQYQLMVMQNIQQGLPPFVMGGSGGGDGQQPGPGGGGGLSPEVASRELQGLGPPAVVPQGGPNVPPGSPRPGARGQ
jgi:hypothetical protein